MWLEIWGSGIRVNKISIFQANFREISIFQAISRKILILIFAGKFLKNVNFSGKFFKNFDFSGNLKQFRFSRQKLLIYSYFWTIFSISLQKSPLSNILISRPVHDPSCEHPTTLPAQNLGNATTNPPGLTPIDMVDRCGVEVCGYSIFATRPVPVAQDRYPYPYPTRTQNYYPTRPVPAGIPVPVTVKRLKFP